ncbi:MAG: metallophosphoesterase, partial [Candidatus Hydrogenedentes bacterium]|nr:metallophosphoesterase [Candidatus Hydrogenedentota bacterium]
MSDMTRRQFMGAAATVAGVSVLPQRAARPEAGAPRIRFGVFADVQYCDCDPGPTRYYREALGKAEACVSAFNAQDLAFVVHLGDAIDRDFVSFDTIVPVFSGLKATGYQVLGNHDYAVDAEKKAEVHARLGMPDRWYAFIHGDWRFVVLDGNDLSLHGRRPGEPEHTEAQALLKAAQERKAPQAQLWNGGIGARQLAWLEGELQDAEAKGQKVVVICHYPVFPENPHNLWNDAELMEAVERHACVKAWFNGHNHAGNYGEHNGVHYVTFKGVVETPDTSAHALVEISAAEIHIQGFGREPDRVLSL